MTTCAAGIELSRPSDPAGTTAEVARAAAAVGYAALQLKQTQYAPFLGDPALLSALLDGGPPVSSLIWLGDAVEAREELLAIAELARGLGAVRVVVCDTAERSRPTTARRRALALDRVAGELADLDVVLSLHHHRGFPIESRTDIRELAQAAPRVRLTIDTGHLGLAGDEPLPGVFAELAERVDNVHLKDLDESGAFRLIGDGALPMRALVDELVDTGFPGAVCIDEESGASLDAGLVRSYETLRTWGWLPPVE